MGNLAHLLGPEIPVLRKDLEELLNFRLHQKEQILWFGSVLSAVGSL